MKTYEKPVLMALSLSGEDLLCGACSTSNMTLWNDASLAESILFLVGRDASYDKDETISEGDFEGIFGSGDGCSTPIQSYCKFTGSSDKMVAWS